MNKSLIWPSVDSLLIIFGRMKNFKFTLNYSSHFYIFPVEIIGIECCNIYSLSPIIGVQCDEDPLLQENRELRQEIGRLSRELGKSKWGVERIKDNDGMTKFYTGLPSFAIFLWLFK